MRMLPLRDYDGHDVTNGLFSTVEGDFDAGTLVSIVSCDPTQDFMTSMTDTDNLGSASHVHNPRWIVPNKIQTATSGTQKFNVLGVGLYNVKQYDSLGRKYYYERRSADEHMVIHSGEAMPVLRKGFLTISDAGFVGTPGPTKLGIVGADGKIEAVTWAELTGKGLNDTHVIGKFMSTTGSCGGYNRTGSYAYFLLDV